MQSGFSMARKERDLQQAVRLLENEQSDTCFHVAQVWYLMIAEGKLYLAYNATSNLVNANPLRLSDYLLKNTDTTAPW